MTRFLVVLGIMVGGLILLAIMGATQSFRAHCRHYGTIPVLYRWFSGHHHHARDPYASIARDSDKPFFRRRFPARLRRAGYRIYFVLVIPWALYAYFSHNTRTWLIFSLFAFFVFLELIRHEEINHSLRVHHRTWVKPLHASLASVIKEPVPEKSSEWLDVAPDRKHAKARMPKNWNGTATERERIAQIMRETLEMDETAQVNWALSGTQSHVVIIDRQPPPALVTLSDISPEIDRLAAIESGTAKTIVLGLGRASEPVKVSLAQDSPHLGLSIGSGGGKSQFARLVSSEILHEGGCVLVLDVKRISHAWARGLPNVRYAKTVEEIHEALMWLSREIDRRTDIADLSADIEGEVLANIGPRILVVTEELNETLARLRRWWTDKRDPRRDPVKSPAVSAFEEALFMGRQLRINMLAVAQMMTAVAAGSGAARENMGVRVLGRYSKNNWRMLVPEFEMPDRSMHPGRVQVVTTSVRECQVAFLTGQEARAFAMSGKVTPFPSEVPADMQVIPMITASDNEAIAKVVGTTTASDDLSLGKNGGKTEVVDAEIVTPELPDIVGDTEPDYATLRDIRPLIGKTINGIRNDRARFDDFPQPVKGRMQGTSQMFDTEEVVNWYKRKRGELVDQPATEK